MSGESILVVEDEANIALGLKQNLLNEGYAVEVIGHGPSGLEAMTTTPFSLVVLDVMLPAMDGFTICKEARARGFRAPILFLSARATPQERVLGLKLGGDDYLGKPFHLAEFLGRVEALLRRPHREADEAMARTLYFAPARATLDWRTHEWRFDDGHKESLARHDLAVFAQLWEAQGAVVSRDTLLEAGWGHDVLPSSRTLDACVGRWRARIETDPQHPQYLLTESGLGYRLRRP